MKRFVVCFNVTEGKIPMIKLVRSLTSCGLRESKELVEEKVTGFEYAQHIEFIVNEEQLGKFLIYNYINPTSSYSVYSIKELEEYRAVDLTLLK